MSLRSFEGPAGSGKTHSLFTELKTHLAGNPLCEGEAVLALTFMHGSRRRLQAKLKSFKGLKGRFLACTVDSLARRIVLRWRTLSLSVEPTLEINDAANYDLICKTAAAILSRSFVSAWVSRRYPTVVIDELQDCKGERLTLIRALESVTHVIAAADEFQDLMTIEPSEAVVWLRTGENHSPLSGNRRTSVSYLLKAASDLRSLEDCGKSLDKKLMGAMNKHVAASHIARALKWNTAKDAVILTPTGSDKSPFVKDVVARLIEKPIVGKSIENGVGPFQVTWEAGVEDQRRPG